MNPDICGTFGWWLYANESKDRYEALPMTAGGNRYVSDLVGWTYDPAVVVKFLRGEAREFDYEHV